MRLIDTVIILIITLALQSCALQTSGQRSATQSETGVEHGAAVASAHPLATRAGIEILQQGGNAFDAAIAVSAALAVVEPYSSGIGGGGFWLLHSAADMKQVMIDGREKAPLAAHRDMYLDDAGDIIPQLSIDGPLAAGIPGLPAALVHLSENYGSLPLATSLKPAIDLARQGFAVDAHYQRMASFRIEALRASDDAASIFLHDGEVPDEGYVIKQPELAETLQAIADTGMQGFYHGEIADKLVDSVRQHGGIWSLRDMAEYQVVEREPIRFEFNDMHVTSVPPPSSGGVAMAQILNILSSYPFDELSVAERKHLLIESMRRAYRDRAEFLGDSDFVDVPVRELTSRAHADALAQDIDMQQATPSDQLRAIAIDKTDGADTTHFSILDAEGNCVSATLSINYPFGSGFVANGTGVLLNDEMDDFSSKPGTPNVYGLVGAEANAIEPGKRMLSSMSPSFALHDDRLVILGTPGGSRIITMVLLGLLEFYDGADAKRIVDAPRMHHQYLPDKVFYEEGALEDEILKALRRKGHELEQLDSRYGNMQAIILNRSSGEIDAASDHRGVGKAMVIE